MYVDQFTRQAYDYATPIACDNNPRNIFELDSDSDDQNFYILGLEPIKRKPPLMFIPSQIKTTIRPNTFTAQDAGIYSIAELNQFWNRILFSKHSDSTLQLLVFLLFLLIHLIMMQTHLMKILLIHYALVYTTN